MVSSSRNRPTLPSPTFCILPWTHLFADELGVLYPCCFGLDAATPNVDEEGTPYAIHGSQPMDESWNSTFMRDLRRDMMSGVRPNPCRLCFQYEDLGMMSYRQNANEDYRHCFDEVLPTLAPDGRAPIAFRSVDIRLGNLCNLRCRMCSPKSSKGLIAEWTQLLQVDRARLRKFQTVDWYTRPEFWQMMETYASKVQKLIFAGGEPLLVEQKFEFLQRLIDLGCASNIELSYITNGTVLPDAAYRIWPHFRSVRLQISLDGYGAVNELIRHPADWSQLDRNLRILDDRALELNVSEMSFNTTVQVYNVLRLSELFDYTFTFKSIKPYPNLSILNYPECFSIQILPAALKREVRRRLQEFEDSHRGKWPREDKALEQFKGKLEGVVTYMMAADRECEIPDFIRRNAIFDGYRKQDTRLVLGELSSLFDHATAHAS